MSVLSLGKTKRPRDSDHGPSNRGDSWQISHRDDSEVTVASNPGAPRSAMLPPFLHSPPRALRPILESQFCHSVQFSCSIMSNSLQPYGWQHASPCVCELVTSSLEQNEPTLCPSLPPHIDQMLSNNWETEECILTPMKVELNPSY